MADAHQFKIASGLPWPRGGLRGILAAYREGRR